jgi:imidazolonepropionase-like amidohydrolase
VEEALHAATKLPAATFGLADRGRIEAGARADLLLVRGDLREDISQVLATEAVFKAGRRVAKLGIRS